MMVSLQDVFRRLYRNPDGWSHAAARKVEAAYLSLRMLNSNPRGLGCFQSVHHKKRQTTYDVFPVATAQTATGIFDNDRVVIYRSRENGAIFIRPVDEFYDGRFEEYVP